MASDRVTAQDVARVAGVSQSAVSRVYTPGASVSQKTMEKVKRAAKDLGYRPNIIARSLITGKSRIIGLVVAYLNNQFYPDALEKMSHALQARGYHVLVFMTSNNDEDLTQVFEEILDYQVDGIIAASVALTTDFASRCKQAGVPVVLFNRSQDVGALSSVTSDNWSGGRKVADFLVAGGHARIGYLADGRVLRPNGIAKAVFGSGWVSWGAGSMRARSARLIRTALRLRQGRCSRDRRCLTRSLWPMIIWPF